MEYTKSFKIAKKSILLLAVYFLILVIVDIGTQIFAYFNSSNQLAIIVANGLNAGVTPVLLLFVGAMIAMITGYFSSISTIELESAKERDNLIIGFFYEVKGLKEKIKKIPTDNPMECYRYLVENKVTIYSKEGLFFILKKEIFVLETPLLEKILEVYSKINLVDELIKDVTTTYRFGTIASAASPNADFVNIPDYIVEIKSQIDVLFLALEVERKKNEN
jgi:hypothetical protein